MKSEMHRWDVSPKDAVKIQREFENKILIQPFTKKINYIAGADISLNRFSTTIYAGIIILTYPDFKPVVYSAIKAETTFPYIPGLLSFREVPALLDVWEQLEIKPDVLVVDGQGIAHPRRLGIAAHLGALLGTPTIGCAKSLLYGTYDEPEKTAGSFSYLYSKPTADTEPEIIGAVLRTKDNVKPVFISPGHLTDVSSSLAIMKECSRGYRIPEPTREAHNLVNKFRLGEIEAGYHTINSLFNS